MPIAFYLIKKKVCVICFLTTLKLKQCTLLEQILVLIVKVWWCCSVTKLCLTLCDSMPSLSVPHHLPEFAQVHVQWIGDAIQLSNPLSPSSPSAFNLPEPGSFPMSQLFTWGSQSIDASASAWVLPKSIQGWFPLKLTPWSPCFPRDSQKFFSSTTVWKYPFFSTLFSLLSSFDICAWLLEKV